ncbi:MAG: hydrogenase expression/formation protein HypE [Candidatus Aenigmarchaeota archaeon]|nr:hydrogenase expression/formation protein HypE [Candidatus Aenigmarchaeota archaeon]
MDEKISLNHGDGGKRSNEIVSKIRNLLEIKNNWNGQLDDGAYLKAGDSFLVMTTDSYTQEPWDFPGGDIGKLSIIGTLNDLAVMGANAIAISLAIVIEEGFPIKDIEKIIKSINDISKKLNIPIVTGDTKVMPKKDLNGIIINTTGIGTTKKIIKNNNIAPGDKIIVSGSIGDHGAAILAKRFEYKTNLVSDCAPVIGIINKLNDKIKAAKDPTRGGLAAIVNEFAAKGNVQIIINEEKIPIKKEARAITDILGIDILTLACEGRVILVVSREMEKEVLKELKKINPDATTIGEVVAGKKVILKTKIGKRFLDTPRGIGVPRIC